MLEFRDVWASYRGVAAARSINLRVEAGTVVLLLGPNGAGKSTLLRLAALLHRPDAGEVRIAGRPTGAITAVAAAQRGVCLIPERRTTFPNLTVRENLWMMSSAGHHLDDIEAEAYTRFPPLADRPNQRAGTLSGGEQQMLALVRALATHPALLLLDEISTGLAPQVVAPLHDAIQSLVREGTTVMMAEHQPRGAATLAHQAVVIARGKIVRQGPPADVMSGLAEAYLGPSRTPEPRTGAGE